jgi:hypothetical protein
MLLKNIRFSATVGLIACAPAYITLYLLLGLCKLQSLQSQPLFLVMFSVIYGGVVAFSCWKAIESNKSFVFAKVEQFDTVAMLCVVIIAVLHIVGSVAGLGLLAVSQNQNDLPFALGAAIILAIPGAILYLDKILTMLLSDRAFGTTFAPGMKPSEGSQTPIRPVANEAKREEQPSHTAPNNEHKRTSDRPSKLPPPRD